MRKTFSALVALAALSGTAFAADLPVRKAAPPAPEYAADWTGFNIGLLGGYGWASEKPDFSTFGRPDGFRDPSGKGWVLGGYVGWSWQLGSAIVVGLEGDYTQADIKDDQTVGGIAIHTKVDRLASVRARAGFLVNPNWLVYGTGGLGLGSAEADVTFGNGEKTTTFTARGNHWGWTAGAGTEYSLGAKIKLRAEYLHYDLGSADYTFTGPNVTINSKLTVDVLRAGLGIQF